MEPTKRTSNYRRMMSSTAIFGGAQVMNVLINIVRGKLVAVILQASGLGVMSLLTNAANTLQQFALLGINISAVRNVSQANENGNAETLALTVRIVRALVLGASLLGLVLTLVFSPLMSQMSFDSLDYLPYFLLLSLAVFINVMGTGEMAVMQGLRRYKRLAFCSIVPPACGLLISIPIYYIWGVQGIVPAMILTGLIYYIAMRLNSYRDSRPRQQRQRLSFKAIWGQGQEIIQFGMIMTLGSILGTITTYALTAFISNTGSIQDVGFYQAANLITMQYISLIFTAMATDFYPRLSSLVQQRMSEARRFVNQQTEIVLLIVTPLSMLMILTAPLLIMLLLTNEFQTISTIVRFMGLASIFKALCFPMDYIAYAKGDKNYILWVESIWGNVKTFTVISTFYIFMGLDGLGYGALCSALIDVVVSLILTRWRYGFRLSADSVQLLTMMLALSSVCFLAAFVPNVWVSYGIMSATTLFCCVYSIRQIDRRMDLRSVWQRYKNRHHHEEEEKV